MLKHCIFAHSLLIVNFMQGTLQKELIMAPFVELFLHMLHRGSLTDNIFQYLEGFT